MNKILLLTGVIAFITLPGCLVREEGGRGHYHAHEYNESHSEVIVAPPTVIVHPPVVIVQ